MLGLAAVFLDGLLEGPEGIDRLLENLNNGNPPDIFGARFRPMILGRLVLCHELGVFAAHHRKHSNDRNDRGQKAGGAHAPVKDEHHHQHGQKQDDCSYNVRQVVGQQCFCIGRRRVQPSSDQPGSVGVKETKGRFHNVGDALFADVGRCAEGRQMGTHKPGKVNDNAAHRKGEGQPAVSGNILCPGPVWRNGDEISGCQPDTDVGGHTKQHGYGRQSQPKEGQGLVAPGITQQSRQVALFFFFHGKTSLYIWLAYTNYLAKKQGEIPPW